jgi:hypothetical protein
LTDALVAAQQTAAAAQALHARTMKRQLCLNNAEKEQQAGHNSENDPKQSLFKK